MADKIQTNTNKKVHQTQDNPATSQKKQIERIKHSSKYHPEIVRALGLKELENKHDGDEIQIESASFRIISHYEFDNANLLVHGFDEEYRSLVANLSSQFQEDYLCKSASEKAVAHLAAQNYTRTLLLQKHINNILAAPEYNELKMTRLKLLNKAYDQATRQFHSSIMNLKLLKQSPVQITVKTDHANIANQQVVQERYDDKSK